MFPRLITAALAVGMLGFMPVSAEDNQIALSEKQIERLGVQYADVEIASRQALAVVPGRITSPLDARLTVAVPFSGTVLTVDVLEGAEVKAGQSLLTIASNDYAQALAQYKQAEAEYRAQKASADRLKSLAEVGIVAAARAETAAAKARQAEAGLELSGSLLANAKQIEGGKGSYSLVAPKSATVAELQVRPGDMIDTLDSAIAMEYAETLWLEADLPARFLDQTAVGEEVRLEASGVEGKIIAIGRIVDQYSRSVTVRAALNSSTGLLPGQSMQATIFGAVQAGALSVPRDALVRLSGMDVVFVVSPTGFTSVPVQVLSRDADKAIIVSEIGQGAKVAVSGLTELKALALEGN